MTGLLRLGRIPDAEAEMLAFQLIKFGDPGDSESRGHPVVYSRSVNPFSSVYNAAIRPSRTCATS